jgi:predicted dehydrogenase
MEASGLGLGFLVTGAGFLGSQRAAAVMAARGCRLVAVHDTDQPRAAAVAGQHGVRVAADYAEALAWDEVDAVIIATPHADHFDQAWLALEAGKHVLCEKPLTIRADEARRLALRADALGLRLATGLNHRFYPPVRDALALISAWSIGRVERVEAVIGHRASPEFLRTWHTDVARSGGGTLMDNGPHACDLIRLLLGEVVAVRGAVRDSLGLPEGCESEATAWFRDHDRGTAELRSSWVQDTGYLTLDITGSEGWLHVETAPWRLKGALEGGRRISCRYLGERLAERRFRGLFGCERSLVREVEAFAARPSLRQPRAEASGWDGWRVTEMIEAAYRSSELGQELTLEPALVHVSSDRPLDVGLPRGSWG